MMQDTSPETARYLRERYAAMSGAERFLIGARMFDTARRIVLASLPADLSPAERRRALFRRLYPELDPNFLQARPTTAKCCGIAGVRHLPRKRTLSAAQPDRRISRLSRFRENRE
ncbi:MAG TPA: hypothetical protein VFX38_08845 [Gammaproteobacteria bacterium]|nr:hypothetical protein [Gammaproteobacteria bacterium]